jgi:hypothetical protein
MRPTQLDEADLKQRYGALPVWGVVSTFAADSFYEGLTLDEAESLLSREVSNESGRSATLVLVVKHEEGRPLL